MNGVVVGLAIVADLALDLVLVLVLARIARKRSRR
jgi:hypothetical protein